MHRRRVNAKGVTVIEAMMTAGLIGFAMAVIFVMAMIGVTAWKRQYVRVKLEREAQATVYVLAKNLRQARSGTITISRYLNPLGTVELDYSLISFERQDKAGVRHSCFVRTVSGFGNGSPGRQIVYSEPRIDAAGNTVYAETVLATDVVHGFFSFPELEDPSKILVNWTFERVPFQNKPPIFVQVKEIIYARN